MDITASNFFSLADTILRGRAGLPEKPAQETGRALLKRLIIIIVTCGSFYGAVMGTFMLSGARIEQVLFSAIKVPLLLGVAFVLSLPSFFVLNTLLGLRDDFTESLRALAAAQAGQSVILASLAPFTLLLYASSTNYQGALLFNITMFALAGLSAQHLLKIYYRPLIERDARHKKLLIGWLVMFGFLGLQLAWMLRPFVGNPNQAPTFIRTSEWTNAYEVVLKLVLDLVR